MPRARARRGLRYRLAPEATLGVRSVASRAKRELGRAEVPDYRFSSEATASGGSKLTFGAVASRRKR